MSVVVPIKQLFTTTEAATMLGLSRPTLTKLVESGEIDQVKVGAHHRIPVQAILDFRPARKARREKDAGALEIHWSQQILDEKSRNLRVTWLYWMRLRITPHG